MKEEVEQQTPPLNIEITESLIDRLRTFCDESFSVADIFESIAMKSTAVALVHSLVRIANQMRHEGAAAAGIMALHQDDEQITLHFSRGSESVYFQDSPTSQSHIELDTIVQLIYPSTGAWEVIEAQNNLIQAFQIGKEVVLTQNR